jgi:hypothetical protein
MNRNVNIRALLLVLLLAGLAASAATANAAPRTTAGVWWGDYFGNANLGGPPILSRPDGAINFDWGLGSPDAAISPDGFSARWTREVWFQGGTYRFTVASDDGVRLWVGDQLVIDDWHDRVATPPIRIDHYVAVGSHVVRVEYYEHTGAAIISIGWEPVVGGETWYGEYFDNRHLNGTPVLSRRDSAVDFNWGPASPDPAVPNDNFSVRWTRSSHFRAGTYRFLTSTDDGSRVWVDGELVVDAWFDQKIPNTNTGTLYLATGWHSVVVEYYEHGDLARAHAWWQLLQPTLPQPGHWHGQYYDNPDLVGGTVMERDDLSDRSEGIAFDWGVGPPASWMPDDNFSVRWTRTVDFAPGYYRFIVQSDDGARLWIDQGILIDKWQDMDYELHYVDGTYLEGSHTIKLEYFEHNGHARVRMWWEPGTDDNRPPTSPGPQTSSGGTGSGGTWQAAYFANTGLDGTPVLERSETRLDHDWGWGSPGPGVPIDRFSVRWTQPLYLPTGAYRFTTYSDDGVRLWIDGALLINAWYPMRSGRSVTVWLNDAIHQVRVEYFEQNGVALARFDWQRAY